ncbi:telomere length regulation protein Elg1 [Aspergillus luchuensis]|uniref:Telomere length regulation protein Elg1 n=1 Tax=Aspergillus kawachii TaxID=1069201 RepID=A0A146F3N9_ASPKA|nr:telomere length regulation protein Elg1 [Aspergillus luchuensis]
MLDVMLGGRYNGTDVVGCPMQRPSLRDRSTGPAAGQGLRARPYPGFRVYIPTLNLCE